ncbi:MAG: carbohydrate binding family 9 domain-containing protein [Acidobacteria bacterium]|nr:carbohydrate binding family 9 domain-containing protein [Acidobacteriota bacterium]
MKQRLFKGLIAVFLFIVVFTSVIQLVGQQNQTKKEIPPAKNYNVCKSESPVKIDGVLNDPAWDNAVLIDVPYEWWPGDNIPAVVKTECLLTFSKTMVYFGFRCYDPDPKAVRAHLMDRDAITTFIMDDHVTLLLDTFNDERRAFQFRVNAIGVQADAFFSELEGFEDFSWDAIWASAGKITDYGYCVEIGIPFNQLRFPKTMEKQTWGICVERLYPRSVRHRLRSHAMDRNKQSFLSQINKITGFENMSSGHNLEFDPTFTVNRTDKRTNFPDGEMDNGKIKPEPGLSARWGITSNLILNATINPDFSQVEADVAQLEVNTRFALRYAEKRPFFLEGADFFLTPMEAVFTRTVYDPLWGVKLTGKVGQNALGFFAAQDSYNTLLFPSNQGSWLSSYKENVLSGVFRYRRDIGKGSTLGFLYTGRTGDNYYNHVAGVDSFLRLTDSKTLNIQVLHSETNYPNEVAQENYQSDKPFGGSSILVNFLHWKRSGGYGLFYQGLTDNFRADYGFVPRVDVHHMEAFIQPVLWPKGQKWFHRLMFLLRGMRISDWKGNLTDQEIHLSGEYQGPMQSIFRTNVFFQKEWYYGTMYKKTVFQNYIDFRPRGGMKCTVLTFFGDDIDYENALPAKTFLIQPTLDIAFGKNISMAFNDTYQRLSRQGETVYSVNLLQAKLVYNLNVRTFFRLILQYQYLKQNQALYLFPVNPKTKTLFTQVLFSYKVNPQTKLFIGYSENQLGLIEFPLTRRNRTFFLKIGYAFLY